MCHWNEFTKEEKFVKQYPGMILSFWYDITWSHNDAPALALVVTQFYRPENRTLQEEMLQHNHLLPLEASYTSTDQYTVQITCKSIGRSSVCPQQTPLTCSNWELSHLWLVCLTVEYLMLISASTAEIWHLK